ncbi:MAG: helix-turn-helix transcriptional regulator [Haliscomenobacter sp.]|jgi:transcriptional regulator with XRE-family HTH domain|nr:helix-turn-helix transcriptional regulator [Haliscomenobacter sp.]MBK8041989.1 helix-turn-helix transcriptional regulator [Haliscomenobacter sp.]MBK8652437.1 helix-turn-helix transcriptional regulator [Haliscomenobacter sp.]MBP9076090.1 helix-turn-helix transcriptional regulator [Haliscomenobacter sp.]MBP9873278.1 helix-turn-helix transcriptional regulator [Haliscomenobacter sp.]
MDDPISKKIRALRLKRNFTQAYMAAQLGISLRSYNKLESGLSRICVDQLAKIARVLDATLHLDVVGREEIHPKVDSPPSPESKLTEIMNRYPERKMDLFFKFLTEEMWSNSSKD